jgi:hypothetical protein
VDSVCKLPEIVIHLMVEIEKSRQGSKFPKCEWIANKMGLGNYYCYALIALAVRGCFMIIFM